ncbi:class I SAM-dependent methyltransferase [Parvibaculum lavamentivorans]|nr:class I SAM-dependent methyltransferase [Parvibaculum lavamentivorans]
MANSETGNLARAKTPEVPVRIEQGLYRHNVIDTLQGSGNVGIELGVAGGIFSRRMVESGKFRMFYGVDLYSDHHDTAEYVRALKHVGIEENYKLLRMSFDDALALFDDHYFDFIYFDGYAHTGEEGGKSFVDWFAKVKVGGVVAGDDYHDDWPLVKWAVNSFARALDVELKVTGLTEKTNLSRYPSWFFTKERDFAFEGLLDDELFSLGQKAKKAREAAAAAAPAARSQVTLTIDQILEFCEKLCAQMPDKAQEVLKIAQRHTAARKAG